LIPQSSKGHIDIAGPDASAVALRASECRAAQDEDSLLWCVLLMSVVNRLLHQQRLRVMHRGG
jgi:hypothetical protein